MLTPEQLADLPAVAEEDVRDALAVVKKFLDSPIWHLYGGRMNEALVSRLNSIMEPAKTVEGVLELEGRKGEYRGIQFALRLPFSIVEMLQADLDRRQEPQG